MRYYKLKIPMDFGKTERNKTWLSGKGLKVLMSQSEFDEQIVIYDQKIYIIQNNINNEGEFFIYVNTRCNEDIQKIVRKNTRLFKAFIKSYRNNPQKTLEKFNKEREKFALRNSAGVENGIKIKKILQEI